MHSSPIETLCLELQLMILREVSDIEGLAHLLTASPRLCHAFSLDRAKILSLILYRTIGEELWPDAVAAVRAEMLPRRSLTRQQRIDYVREYHRFQNEPHYPPVDLRTAIGLCRIHWAVRYHAKRFAQHSISFLVDCAKGLSFGPDNPAGPEGTAVTSALSAAEETRLFRAFFRFQLYGRLFYNAGAMKEDEQRALFASKLLPWEVEEIASVYGYLTRLIHTTFDEAGEEYLDMITTEHDLAAAVGGIDDPMEVDEIPGITDASRAVRYFESRLEGDIARKSMTGLFWDRGIELCQARLKSYLVTSGLCHLRRLFESSGDERSRLVSTSDDCGKPLNPPSMNRLIDFALTRGRMRPHEIILAESPAQEPQTTEDANSAWHWAHGGNSRADWSTGFFHELRSWGYVFWDDSRVRTSGLFEQTYVIFFLDGDPN
jgi:hypothetical protein